MIYFDSNYIVRLYARDAGWEKVRALAASDDIACCMHGLAEAAAAFHRKFREGAISRNDLRTMLAEFNKDCAAGAFDWLALSPVVVERVVTAYATLPATNHLRAADALHLACAAENSFTTVYSNDPRFLEAASYFGLKPANII